MVLKAFLDLEPLRAAGSRNSEAISSPASGWMSEAFTSAMMLSSCSAVGVWMPSFSGPLYRTMRFLPGSSSPRSLAATIDRTWALRLPMTCWATCSFVSGSMYGSLSKKLLMSGRTYSALRRVGAFLTAFSRLLRMSALTRATSSSLKPKRFIRSSSV